MITVKIYSVVVTPESPLANDTELHQRLIKNADVVLYRNTTAETFRVMKNQFGVTTNPNTDLSTRTWNYFRRNLRFPNEPHYPKSFQLLGKHNCNKCLGTGFFDDFKGCQACGGFGIYSTSEHSILYGDPLVSPLEEYLASLR